MNKKILFIVGIVLLILIGVGSYFIIFNKEEPKKEKNDVVEKEEKEEVKETPKLQIIDESSKTRPLAVMINNHNQARPNHSGLQDAYVIYETVVEGGITRMMALYKDATTARIGSVRSARTFYLDYALEHDAIYVHFGYSQYAKKDIPKLGVDNINGLFDNFFWRDKTLNVDYEHTAFTSMEKINSFVSSKKYRNTSDKELLLNYSVDNIDLSSKEGAIAANKVTIPYSYYMTSSYTYDEQNKYYLRYANSVPHTDAVTKQQYHFKNVIVINVGNSTVDDYGRQFLDNIGTGTGYYITNGYALPITWQKDSRSSQTIYKYQNGEEITVNDGNTFIQIQPIEKKTTFE